MNLYELKDAYKMIQEMINSGDDVKECLESVSDGIEKKADGYAKIITNTTAQIEAIKKEEQRLKDKRTQLEASVKELKENLFAAMKETGKTKFKTDLFSFAIQKNGGKAPVILDVNDTSELPDHLVRIKEEPDLDAIRALLDAGACKYAHYGERGESLRIK